MTYEDLSERILMELQRDGRQSFRELAETFDVSPTTIRKRVEDLEQSGVLKGVRAEIDYEKLGYSYVAMLRLKVAGEAIEVALEQVGRHPEFTNIYEITGDYDILCVGYFRNRDHLNTVIKEVQRSSSVRSTNTSMILNPYREHAPLPLVDEEERNREER